MSFEQLSGQSEEKKPKPEQKTLEEIQKKNNNLIRIRQESINLSDAEIEREISDFTKEIQKFLGYYEGELEKLREKYEKYELEVKDSRGFKKSYDKLEESGDLIIKKYQNININHSKLEVIRGLKEV